MGYFLRQDNKKNGMLYLQMYETYWDRNRKQPRSRCVELRISQNKTLYA